MKDSSDEGKDPDEDKDYEDIVKEDKDYEDILTRLRGVSIAVPSSEPDDDWEITSGDDSKAKAVAVEVGGSQPTEVETEVEDGVGGSQPTEGVTVSQTYYDTRREGAQQPEGPQPDEAEGSHPYEPESEHPHEPTARLRRDAVGDQPTEVGSQPTDIVLKAVGDDGSETNLGIATVAFFYQEDPHTWQLVDDTLLQKLREDKTPGYWKGTGRSGNARKYWVDPEKLTSMNVFSKKVRTMRSLYMFVVPPSCHVAVPGFAMDLLTQDGWTFMWQFQDYNGWKNMGLEANKRLLDAWGDGKSEVELEHWWKKPRSTKWQKTMYDVNIQTLKQKSREGTHNERPVRLVALADPGGGVCQQQRSVVMGERALAHSQHACVQEACAS